MPPSNGVPSVTVKELPPAPDPPQTPADLSVPEFSPASHVAPDDTEHWPQPVTVVLHGNFDRPEWECATWKETAGFYGWILCPRGIRTPWASLREDRWTYRGPARVQTEIEACLDALEKRYPARVSREGTVLAGFSLGAIYAPGLSIAHAGKYPTVFLVEGGTKKLDRKMIKRMKRAGVTSIGLAMSAPGRRSRARDALEKIHALGLRGVFVDMRGAGHAYRSDFTTTGQQALRRLVEPDQRTPETKDGSP